MWAGNIRFRRKHSGFDEDFSKKLSKITRQYSRVKGRKLLSPILNDSVVQEENGLSQVMHVSVCMKYIIFVCIELTVKMRE